MVLVKFLTSETTIMWISIAAMIIVISLSILISLQEKKPAMRETSEDYVDKVARRKEIDKQIKTLATIAITTKDTLDKLRNEQAELDKWLEAYKIVNKE